MKLQYSETRQINFLWKFRNNGFLMERFKKIKENAFRLVIKNLKIVENNKKMWKNEIQPDI